MLETDSESPPDDGALALRVARAAPGIDREAEAELYRRLAPRARLYGLRHLRSESAAADLMQQVLLMTIERLRAGALRDPGQLASFVLGMCRMVVLDLKRGDARRERLLETYGDILVPEDVLPPSPDRARLVNCLDGLSERERTVLIMTFYDDLPAETLAREVDLSPANVRVIRHRALERLRRCVSGERS
jgi:RNA polymerase sigma-70 factor, ECF subfamily